MSIKQDIRRSSIDYPLLGAVCMLIIIGTLAILSAVWGTGFQSSVARTHLLAIPAGAAAFFFGWVFNYQIFEDRWKILYGAVLLVLILVLIPHIGSYQRGSRSWFNFGFFSLQPAEICRVATLLIAAAVLDRYKRKLGELGLLAGVCGVVGVIFALIMMQPDFSSIVITLPALFFLLYVSGVNVLYLLGAVLFGVFAGAFPLLWTYLSIHPALIKNSFMFNALWQMSGNIWYMAAFVGIIFIFCFLARRALRYFKIAVPGLIFLFAACIMSAGFTCAVFVNNKIKPYQRKRIEAFLAPNTDPRGASYNVLQAQIAMGSGGVFGKGLFSGTQSRLGFVPEKHTDFILAVVGEEAGLLGTLAVLGLYIFMLWRIMLIAYRASSGYGYLVCSGVFAMFFTYMAVNFGMLIGLVPVAGVPLPLISYGGTNFVASLWALGIVQSVHARRISFR